MTDITAFRISSVEYLVTAGYPCLPMKYGEKNRRSDDEKGREEKRKIVMIVESQIFAVVNSQFCLSLCDFGE